MRYKIMGKIGNEVRVSLACLGRSESAEHYIGQCAKIAAVGFALFLLLCNLLSELSIEAFAVSFFGAIGIFAFAAQRPKMELQRRARKIEKDLPFAMMQLSVGLNIGMPFDVVLLDIADGNYGELSTMLGRHLRAARSSGRSVPDALLQMASVVKSRQLSRTVSQLISLYEQGTKKSPGESVRRMALEQLARQKSEAKEFSGRLSVFSLAFIVVSAIVPALFQSFVIVGASFMEIPFSALQIIAIVAIGFPALDAILLLYMRSATPEFLRG